MDEWWMSFLGDIVWESLHPMKNTNEKGPDDLSHKQNTKLKPSSSSHDIKTSAEIHKDWNSDHFNHKSPKYSISTSQEKLRTVNIISKSDIAEIELQWDL